MLNSLIFQGVKLWSRGLMDKALASGAGDCGFESHRDRASSFIKNRASYCGFFFYSFKPPSFGFFWLNFACPLFVSTKMAKSISVFYFFSKWLDRIRSL